MRKTVEKFLNVAFNCPVDLYISSYIWRKARDGCLLACFAACWMLTNDTILNSKNRIKVFAFVSNLYRLLYVYFSVGCERERVHFIPCTIDILVARCGFFPFFSYLLICRFLPPFGGVPVISMRNKCKCAYDKCYRAEVNAEFPCIINNSRSVLIAEKHDVNK